MINKISTTLIQTSVATFSDCEKYRYRLKRIWDTNRPLLGYVMLNPSTADENVNDPTIERCQRRASMLGYGGIYIANLFPYRSTDKSVLSTVEDLYGCIEEANESILTVIQDTHLTVIGWGRDGNLNGRATSILRLIQATGYASQIACLDINADGSPKHPLYVGYEEKIKPFFRLKASERNEEDNKTIKA